MIQNQFGELNICLVLIIKLNPKLIIPGETHILQFAFFVGLMEGSPAMVGTLQYCFLQGTEQ